MNVVRKVHDGDFADVVLGSAVPVVVGFCADDRSPASEPLTVVLDEIAAAGSDLGVVRVDVDSAPRMSTAYGISVVPSVVVFSGGTMLLALPGVPSRDTILHMLRVAAAAPPTTAWPV